MVLHNTSEQGTGYTGYRGKHTCKHTGPDETHTGTERTCKLYIAEVFNTFHLNT